MLLIAPAFADSLNPGRDLIKRLGRRLSTLRAKEGYILSASLGEWKQAGFSPEAMACIAGCPRSHPLVSLGVACETVADWMILHSMDELAILQVPAHILTWDGDPVLPVSLAQAMADTIPDACLTVLPSAAILFDDIAIAGRTFAEFPAWDSAPPGV